MRHELNIHTKNLQEKQSSQVEKAQLVLNTTSDGKGPALLASFEPHRTVSRWWLTKAFI